VIIYGTLLFCEYTAFNCIVCSVPIFDILSAVTNYLLAILPLNFGGRFLGQHFTYDVAPTLDTGQQFLPLFRLYGVAAYDRKLSTLHFTASVQLMSFLSVNEIGRIQKHRRFGRTQAFECIVTITRAVYGVIVTSLSTAVHSLYSRETVCFSIIMTSITYCVDLSTAVCGISSIEIH